jgi:hypothetical protein
MNTALWIVQSVLAFAFVAAGGIKSAQPKEALEAKMAWTQDFSQGVVRLIGLLEILGAAGLVLPMMLDIYPWLTHFAAAGLALLMLGAAGTHVKRREWGLVFIPLTLAAMAAFVALNRGGPAH